MVRFCAENTETSAALKVWARLWEDVGLSGHLEET
jgi:hypothetical protein